MVDEYRRMQYHGRVMFTHGGLCLAALSVQFDLQHTMASGRARGKQHSGEACGQEPQNARKWECEQQSTMPTMPTMGMVLSMQQCMSPHATLHMPSSSRLHAMVCACASWPAVGQPSGPQAQITVTWAQGHQDQLGGAQGHQDQLGGLSHHPVPNTQHLAPSILCTPPTSRPTSFSNS